MRSMLYIGASACSSAVWQWSGGS